MTDYAIIAMRLMNARLDAKLSQKVAAAAIAKSQQRVSAYELGKCEPNVTNLQKLCDCYGISVTSLFGEAA